jgi:hypothetical protein
MNWKIALVASALALAGGSILASGCGGDDCTRADDHMAECAASTSSSGSSTTASGGTALACSGALLCRSQCINEHTCTQITGNDPGYTLCMEGCKGK